MTKQLRRTLVFKGLAPALIVGGMWAAGYAVGVDSTGTFECSRIASVDAWYLCAEDYSHRVTLLLILSAALWAAGAVLASAGVYVAARSQREDGSWRVW